MQHRLTILPLRQHDSASLHDSPPGDSRPPRWTDPAPDPGLRVALAASAEDSQAEHSHQLPGHRAAVPCGREPQRSAPAGPVIVLCGSDPSVTMSIAGHGAGSERSGWWPCGCGPSQTRVRRWAGVCRLGSWARRCAARTRDRRCCPPGLSCWQWHNAVATVRHPRAPRNPVALLADAMHSAVTVGDRRVDGLRGCHPSG
jgi:hypothetical protein